jgi:hypothetical protein
MQSPSDWNERVTVIQGALERVEAEFARGELPAEGLADFKRAVDDIRLRVWALLSAESPDAYQAFHERFRIRRALELLQRIRDDLTNGGMAADHQELDELARTAAEFCRAVEARRR